MRSCYTSKTQGTWYGSTNLFFGFLVFWFLGYAPANCKPGLPIWSSQSRDTRIALVETAKKVFGEDTGELPHASRLIFKAESKDQIYAMQTLLDDLGATVLVNPKQYNQSPQQLGIVFRYSGGAIFELKWRDGPRRKLRKPVVAFPRISR